MTVNRGEKVSKEEKTSEKQSCYVVMYEKETYEYGDETDSINTKQSVSAFWNLSDARTYIKNESEKTFKKENDKAKLTITKYDRIFIEENGDYPSYKYEWSIFPTVIKEGEQNA